MNIYEISGRHLEVTDAMRNYVTDKLEHLETLHADVVDAKVVMSYSGKGTVDKPHKVEIQLNLPHTIIRSEERARDAYQAIDTAVGKLERQLKRHQSRYKPSHKKTKDITDVVVTSDEENDDVILPSNIARIKKHVLRPMTPDDAAFQMEFLGHTFYMFRNSNSDDVNVVYLRHDGTFGLLQPS